jgi:hypothetical protein
MEAVRSSETWVPTCEFTVSQPSRLTSGLVKLSGCKAAFFLYKAFDIIMPMNTASHPKITWYEHVSCANCWGKNDSSTKKMYGRKCCVEKDMRKIRNLWPYVRWRGGFKGALLSPAACACVKLNLYILYWTLCRSRYRLPARLFCGFFFFCRNIKSTFRFPFDGTLNQGTWYLVRRYVKKCTYFIH